MYTYSHLAINNASTQTKNKRGNTFTAIEYYESQGVGEALYAPDMLSRLDQYRV